MTEGSSPPPSGERPPDESLPDDPFAERPARFPAIPFDPGPV